MIDIRCTRHEEPLEFARSVESALRYHLAGRWTKHSSDTRPIPRSHDPFHHHIAHSHYLGDKASQSRQTERSDTEVDPILALAGIHTSLHCPHSGCSNPATDLDFERCTECACKRRFLAVSTHSSFDHLAAGRLLRSQVPTCHYDGYHPSRTS